MKPLAKFVIKVDTEYFSVKLQLSLISSVDPSHNTKMIIVYII